MRKFKYLKKIKTNQKGISIIEVLISFSLISLALVSILSLVGQNMQAQYINRGKLIASQLAQECQEMIRNKRDNNWLGTRQNFYKGIADPSGIKNYIVPIDGSILIDITTVGNNANNFTNPAAILHLCNGGNYNKVYANDFAGFAHGCNAADSSSTMGPATIFKRIVTTQYNSSASSTDISCDVEWQDRNRTQNYITSGVLYNWGF